MLTIEQFKKLPAGKTFASGVLPNSEKGLFMTRDGGELKWLAIKGWGNDWAVYCHWAHQTDEYIFHHGDKVVGKDNIQKCVPCEPEVLNLYRK